MSLMSSIAARARATRQLVPQLVTRGVPRVVLVPVLVSLVSLVSLVACGPLGDMVGLSPGTRAPDARTPAGVALQVRLPATSQRATTQVGIEASYRRSNQTSVIIAAATFTPSPGATSLPVSIDLSACLNDTQRLQDDDLQTDSGSCLMNFALTLLTDGQVVDRQSIGPVELRPGTNVTVSDQVTLIDVTEVRISPTGSVQLGLGSSVTMSATLVSATGGTLGGRAVEWTSDAPGVARVDRSTGVVTTTGVGRARVSATYGSRTGGTDVNVIPVSFSIIVSGGAGTGAGTVRSTPVSLNCRVVTGVAQGPTCASSFNRDASITLTATVDTGSVFGGWSGACSGTTSSCTVVASADRSVSASFRRLSALSIIRAGAGAGTVTSAPGGIACPSTCVAQYLEGTSVTLTAAPSAGSTFTGWSGACTGSSTTCTVTVNAAASVTATFALIPTFGLSVATTGGQGSGIVASTPTGISCPTVCTRTFPVGTTVTLTATPQAGSVFGRWTGACSGTQPTCTITPSTTGAVTATAAFNVATGTLTISTAGSRGTGTVTSSPAGVNCPTTCSAAYPLGSLVTLTARPLGNSFFGGWSGGGCAGTALTCTVRVDAASVSVSALFSIVIINVTAPPIDGSPH